MKYPLMPLALLTTAIATVSTNAHALSGKVVDQNGDAVANAQIEAIGSHQKYLTNARGEFNIPGKTIDEIHIEAPGFSHKVFHLHGKHQGALTVELSRAIIEVVDVIGLPIHASKIESAQPISVLSGEELIKKQASTLGETLKNEVGVQSTSYGGVAASPIIRSLDGPRVLVTQNGLDTGDVSRIGPDHAVTTEASTAQQIEILRGPATLFYGSGAIGGVINIVDDRVPQNSDFKAAVATEYNSVNNESLIAAGMTGGNDLFAAHIDMFARNSKDYDIPGFADYDADHETDAEHEEEGHEEHARGTLANSGSEGKGINLGGSWLLDNGFVGLSYGHLERQNGIPGHSHVEQDHEDEHAEDEDHNDEHEEDSHEEHAEENILSDYRQNRWQLLGEYQVDGNFLNKISASAGYTDYTHAELHEEEHEEHDEDEHEDEHDEGTVFNSTTTQLRVNFHHNEIAGWKGAFSLENKNIDFEASGAEAFTPNSQTQEFGFAVIEEKHAGSLLWQLGARIERVSLKADDLHLAHQEHAHEEELEDEHDDEHGEEHNEAVHFEDLDFTPFSLSAGVVWDFADGYNMGISLAHAERAPSAAELFSAGEHIATRTFEVGALFDIHEEEHEGETEYHLDYHGEAKKEVSNNIDLSIRKFEGDFGFVINLFYNQITDYYALTHTGLTTEDLFSDKHDEHAAGMAEAEEEHDHGASVLPIHIFSQQDATIRGLEAELAWQFHSNAKWTVWGDTVNAKLDNGGYLPRTSPTRLANQLNIDYNAWGIEIDAVKYFEQNKTAINETSSEGYTLLNARIKYTLPFGNNSQVYLAGNNLSDKQARAHTSFLKKQAPLPGRNIKLGFSAKF
ncbi:TonB-dependent receptor [Marinagarivorans algicola]|uniref:TonB-dependent receptor n=1 Tax=Marinagarivorans algicola TaxID=1513270 RepID=UPI000AAEDEE4|nr:TonB-dependent receptor [Marinagarivorans algicola]